MELRPGYKQTEVGVIPEDWDVGRIGDVAEANWGNTLITKSSYREDGFQAFSAAGPDGYLSWFEHERPAVVLSAIGALCGKTWLADRKWTAIKNTIWIQGDDSKTTSAFVFRITGGINFWPKRGQAQPFISLGDVRDAKIPLPSFPEQSVIAEALGDVDALLSGLDALIAKKRDLKQAAMQQLLTGKTRLPGFDGEWELRRLGNHVSFIKNGVNSRAELGVGDRAKYLHYGDIHTTSDVFLLPESASMPTLAAEKAARLGRLADGDVVFVDATEDLAGVGKSVEIRDIGDVEVVAGLHTIAARFDKVILADGFKAYLQFIPAFGRHLRALAAGTKVFATNRAHIASAEIALPSTEEQVAIAEALHDMDAELSALEARRDKTRLLKQGMMQELLTGRTRLA